MDKNTIVKVANRKASRVGYKIPELGIQSRQFMPRETKDITFEELERLSFIPGGMRILKEYLVIRDQEALDALGLQVEPEYFYTEEDVKKLLQSGSLEAFLDCLDFAPMGILDMIKEFAVELPLESMVKREAILEKLNFDVTNAIKIKNTKFDGGDEDTTAKAAPATRRVAIMETANEDASARRVSAPKYKVTTIAE